MEYQFDQEIIEENKGKQYPSWMLLVWALCIGIPTIAVFLIFILIYC